jgi:hypothetical protein
MVYSRPRGAPPRAQEAAARDADARVGPKVACFTHSYELNNTTQESETLGE